MQNTNTPISSVRGSVQALQRAAPRLAVVCSSVVRDGRKPRTASGAATATSAATASRCAVTETPSATIAGADERAGDRADAEARVEARHDRLPEPRSTSGALDVHRHVPGAAAEAEQEQADRRPGATPRASRSPAVARPAARDQRHHADRARGAEPGDDEAGERHRDQRADRDRQQHEAELLRVELEPVADLRDPRRPAREREAAEDEDGVDGAGGAREVHGRTTSIPACS